MPPRTCPYCQHCFQPAECHPGQLVCSGPECQRQRRTHYRRAKFARDPAYAEKCRESARQWRKQHPDYWTQYRQAHPHSVTHNREQQTGRDCKRRLTNLANNTLASDLTPCPAKVWLMGPEWHNLANNTSAHGQLWILQALPQRKPVATPLANNTPLASCPALPA